MSGAHGSRAAEPEAETPGGEARVSTGNATLDEILRGGLVAHRPYLLVGPCGSGKTKLALQFLCDGARRGERVLLVTLEDPPNEMRINHRAMQPALDAIQVFDAIPDVMRYERAPFKDIAAVRSSVLFSQVSPEIRKTAELVSVEVTFSALEQTLKMEMARQNYSRLVVDSLTALQYFCMKGIDETQGAQSFLRFLSDLRVTALLTVESPVEEVESAERLLARGEIRLFRWELDGRTVRAIGVEKFRGSAHDNRLHPYRISPSGLDIDLQTTISRDTRRVVEPTVQGSAEEPSGEASPRPLELNLLLSDIHDLAALGIDVTAAEAEVAAGRSAGRAGKSDEVAIHYIRARAIIGELAQGWNPRAPAIGASQTTAANRVARITSEGADLRAAGAPPRLLESWAIEPAAPKPVGLSDAPGPTSLEGVKSPSAPSPGSPEPAAVNSVVVPPPPPPPPPPPEEAITIVGLPPSSSAVPPPPPPPAVAPPPPPPEVLASRGSVPPTPSRAPASADARPLRSNPPTSKPPLPGPPSSETGALPSPEAAAPLPARETAPPASPPETPSVPPPPRSGRAEPRPPLPDIARASKRVPPGGGGVQPSAATDAGVTAAVALHADREPAIVRKETPAKTERSRRRDRAHPSPPAGPIGAPPEPTPSTAGGERPTTGAPPEVRLEPTGEPTPVPRELAPSTRPRRTSGARRSGKAAPATSADGAPKPRRRAAGRRSAPPVTGAAAGTPPPDIATSEAPSEGVARESSPEPKPDNPSENPKGNAPESPPPTPNEGGTP